MPALYCRLHVHQCTAGLMLPTTCAALCTTGCKKQERKLYIIKPKDPGSSDLCGCKLDNAQGQPLQDATTRPVKVCKRQQLQHGALHTCVHTPSTCIPTPQTPLYEQTQSCCQQPVGNMARPAASAVLNHRDLCGSSMISRDHAKVQHADVLLSGSVLPCSC